MKGTKTLILGASGTVGSHVMKLYHESGEYARAAFHKEEVPDQAYDDFVLIDYDEVDGLLEAADGFNQVFVVIPDSPSMAMHARHIVQACEASGVCHYVVISGAGVELSPHNVVSQRLQAMETLFENSNMNGIILRPVFFMQNFINHFPPTPECKIIQPMGSGKVNYIDVRDVALASYQVLIQLSQGEKFEKNVWCITGDKSYTMDDIVDIFSAKHQSAYEYIDADLEQVMQKMKSKGLPQWRVQMLSEIYQSIQQNHYDHHTSDLMRLINRDPRTFCDFALDYKSFFINNYQLNH